MKNLWKSILPAISFIFLFQSYSCNEKTESANLFKTKEDSLMFAKEIIKKYPEIQGPKVADFINEKTSSLANGMIPKFNPIDWKDIQTYAANYDKFPIIKDKSGFLINTKGISFIRANTKYEQIYLRFGKYSDNNLKNNDYTIMIIPLDKDSAVIHRGPASQTIGTNSNYDELDPCPKACPKGFN